VFGPFAEYIREQWCCCCGAPGSDPHHVKSRGAGGQDENNLVPLCRTCHTSVHTRGRATFEKFLGFSLTDLATEYWERYNEEKK
jgi:hypothetical protein